MGFTQILGNDFTDSFAPVVSDVTVQVLLILWMVYMWYTQLLDVETVFLYGDLDVPLFMHLPGGMDQILALNYSKAYMGWYNLREYDGKLLLNP